MQASVGFFHRRLSVVANLNFRHAGAAVERQHWNGLAVDVKKIQRHSVTLKDFNLDDRLGMFLFA